MAAALVHVLTEFQTANPAFHVVATYGQEFIDHRIDLVVDSFSDDLGSKIMKNRLIKEERTKLFLTLGCSLVDAVFHIRGHPRLHLTFSKGMRPLVTVRWTGKRFIKRRRLNIFSSVGPGLSEDRLTKIMAAIEEIQNSQLPAQREANVIAVTVKVNAVKPQAPLQNKQCFAQVQVDTEDFCSQD